MPTTNQPLRPTKAHALLTEACQALDIKNPILNFTVKGDTITIWFLARKDPVKYTRKSKSAQKASA